jgi:hypothetical protein
MTLSESVLKMNEKKLKYLLLTKVLITYKQTDIMNRTDMLEVSLKNVLFFTVIINMLSFLNNAS